MPLLGTPKTLKDKQVDVISMKFTLFLVFASLFTIVSASDIHITLRQENLDYLYSRAWSVSDPDSAEYLHFWSEKEIRNLVSPSLSNRLEVIKWLTDDLGIPSVQIKDRGDSIVFPYNLTFANILRNKPVPDRVQRHIDIIIGLAPPRGVSSRLGRRSVAPGLVGKEVIERLYNVSLVGDGVDIGVVEYDLGEGFSQADVHSYQAANGIIPRNVTHIIGSDYGDGGEGELDIQMISNLKGANLWFISINGWIYDFASEFFTWKEYPTILSHSYGWAEDAQCSIVTCTNFTSADYIRRTNTELAKIALKGVTMLVSSGDAGSPGRTNEVCMGKPKTNPVYPGSSPWILSVGATYLVADDAHFHYKTQLCKEYGCVNGTIEIETYFNSTDWTSGAGFGIYSEPRNKWQAQAISSYLNSGVQLPPKDAFNRNGRAYPDISTIGHNCAVFIDGALLGEDGTSCSSPVMAALVGYISRQLGSKLGVFAPALYKLYYQHPELFNDVTVGYSECTEATCCSHSWGFKATRGWDVASGLGTPNVGRITEELRKFM